MKRLFFAIPFVILFSCNQEKTKATKLSDFIASESSIILKIDDLESFQSDWESNNILTGLSGSMTGKHLDSLLGALSYFPRTSEVLVGFNSRGDSSKFTIATRIIDSTLEFTQASNLFTRVVDSMLIMSNSKSTIESLKSQPNQSLEELLRTSKANASFSVILDESTSSKFANVVLGDSINSFANATIFDSEVTQDQIKLNGISVSTDSIPKVISFLENTIPQENTLQNLIPINFETFTGLTFDDFETIQLNMNRFNQSSKDSIRGLEVFQTINEIGLITFESNSILVMKSIDISATQDALQEYQEVVTAFRNTPIYSYSNSEQFKDVLHPIIRSNSVSFYAILDDYVVFSDSENAIENLISSYQNGTVLSKDPAYENAMLHLSDESSLISISNAQMLRQRLSKVFETESDINTDAYKLSIVQLVQDDAFTHINGIIQKHKSQRQRNNIIEEFSTRLDADIITDPQFVTNHRTKGQDIAVQDINNVLYLISNGGQILWKKSLNGTILGKIEQVDLYKNGRLQLAFATAKRVYILDRNGNDVSPFPLKFNDDITLPLSVFDYDNTKNYRFLVSQGSNLLMYDKQGKTVRGFDYSSSGTIGNQPKHFRHNGKDYIVFSAGNTLKILDRRGKIRVNTSETYNFSDQNMYFYKNHFTTTNSNGDLIQVNTRGQASSQHIGLAANHSIDATSKTLVTLVENKLGIKRNTVELDFGNYSTPKIHYLNDKIYVTLTDLQTQRVYMFDSQAKSIPNFPVYGNSTVDLKNMDADRRLEFVTKGESNSIIVYEMN